MPPASSAGETTDRLKRAAAEKAVEALRSGMVVGLGTGSTASFAVDAIGRRVAAGELDIVGIPTSEATAARARRLGIALGDPAIQSGIDVTIDGADAVDLKTLALIKGLGGALLREKIVADASDRMVVIIDETKIVPSFDGRTVPVEIERFGWAATGRRIAALGGTAVLRPGPDGTPRLTDGGNFIVDCVFTGIADWAALHTRLKAVVGVIETGLFIGMADEVIAASPGSVRVFRAGDR